MCISPERLKIAYSVAKSRRTSCKGHFIVLRPLKVCLLSWEVHLSCSRCSVDSLKGYHVDGIGLLNIVGPV